MGLKRTSSPVSEPEKSPNTPPVRNAQPSFDDIFLGRTATSAALDFVADVEDETADIMIKRDDSSSPSDFDYSMMFPSKEDVGRIAIHQEETSPPPAGFIAGLTASGHLNIPPHDDRIYLELGDASITNMSWHHITATDFGTSGMEVWMRGEAIFMALECLRRDLDCDRYGIDIVNGDAAQAIRWAAIDNNPEAYMYDVYRQRYINSRYVFVVVNDAYGQEHAQGTQGTHWSLIAVDRRLKKAHYYDSLRMGQERFETANTVVRGLLMILGDDCGRYDFVSEDWSPSQISNNIADSDAGACGPFIFMMTWVLATRIIKSANFGMNCRLNLVSSFPAWFGARFDSIRIREHMQHRISRWQAIMLASGNAQSYDGNILNEMCQSGGQNLHHLQGPPDDIRTSEPPHYMYDWTDDLYDLYTHSDLAEEREEREARPALQTIATHHQDFDPSEQGSMDLDISDDDNDDQFKDDVVDIILDPEEPPSLIPEAPPTPETSTEASKGKRKWSPAPKLPDQEDVGRDLVNENEQPKAKLSFRTCTPRDVADVLARGHRSETPES